MRVTALAFALRVALAAGACIDAWPPGTVFGAQYGAPSNATLANETGALFAELLARNATLAQIGIPWASLETTPGAPNYLLLAELLYAAVQEGLTPLVNIAAINTNVVSVPSDLADPVDPTRLRPGLNWTSSEVIDRYAQVLFVAAPLVAFYGGGYLGLGNEVDANLGEHPETGAAFVEFAILMREFARNVTRPRPLDVGVTFTVGGLAAASQAPPPLPAWLSALITLSDVTPLTYYPLLSNFSVDKDWAGVNATLHAAIDVLPPTACLVFQELGCPSGYGNASSTDGSSEATQATFFKQAVGELRRIGAETPRQLRGLSAYELLDAPPDVCTTEAAYYNITAPAFVEYLCTLGLVDAEGTPKAAFAAFLEAISD